MPIPIEQQITQWKEKLERRNTAVKSLLKSLKHLSREQQFSILTSWIPLEQLETMANELRV